MRQPDREKKNAFHTFSNSNANKIATILIFTVIRINSKVIDYRMSHAHTAEAGHWWNLQTRKWSKYFLAALLWLHALSCCCCCCCYCFVHLNSMGAISIRYTRMYRFAWPFYENCLLLLLCSLWECFSLVSFIYFFPMCRILVSPVPSIHGLLDCRKNMLEILLTHHMRPNSHTYLRHCRPNQRGMCALDLLT